MALSSVIEGWKLQRGSGSCILKRPFRSRQTLCSGPRSRIYGAARSMAAVSRVSKLPRKRGCQEETSRDISQI